MNRYLFKDKKQAFYANNRENLNCFYLLPRNEKTPGRQQ